ncbi:MAG: hypothetical protein ACLVH9_06000 [Fusobacterium sp.]|uniref:hypothetical protein n=1 Tax=Fusobacterium sp. TaxID=68766 RepID=UPI00399ACE21
MEQNTNIELLASGENYTTSEFLKLILPDEERVIYISDLVENFLLLDKYAKNADANKLEKGGYTGTAKNLHDEIIKKASASVLGRVLIGTGIDVDTNGRISLGKHKHTKEEISDFDHNHDDRYYTESEIDNKLQELLDKMTIEDLESLIGDNYRGHYNVNTKYYNGDIYYKKDTTTLSLTIPDKLSNTIAFLIPAVASPALTKEMTSEDKRANSSPALTKAYQISDIKKFFRLYGEAEREYNFTDNSDNKIIGFAVEDSNRLIRTNSTIIFEISTINYTVALEIPNTDTPILIKTLTASQNNTSTALSKTQSDTPIYSHDTQRSPILRKINY